MGFSFTHQQYLGSLFTEGMTNEILYGSSSIEVSEQDWNGFLEIGKRFFVLRHVLQTIIEELTKTDKSKIFSNEKIKHLIEGRSEYKNRKSLRGLLMKYIFVDWFMYLSISATTPLNVNNLLVVDYTRSSKGHGLVWFTLESRMNSFVKEILDAIGISHMKNINIGTIEFKKR